ncbi:MAG: hypothetical protein H6559_21560 [Lewinellaceae bacterium]|nr:hypothetical protein [Lewinellaceae bacterium]
MQPYNLGLLEAHTIPEMHYLYLELLDTLSRLSEEEMLFMHFSFISPLGDTPRKPAGAASAPCRTSSVSNRLIPLTTPPNTAPCSTTSGYATSTRRKLPRRATGSAFRPTPPAGGSAWNAPEAPRKKSHCSASLTLAFGASPWYLTRGAIILIASLLPTRKRLAGFVRLTLRHVSP